MKMKQIDWRRTRDIIISIIGICVIFWSLCFVLGQFVDVLILLILSLAIAFLISPLVNWLQKHRIPRVWGTLLSYIVILGLLAFFGYELVFALINQAQNFAITLNAFAVSIPNRYQASIKFLERTGIPAQSIQNIISSIQSQAFDFAASLGTNAVNIVFTLSNGFINVFLIIVISFYLVADGKHIRDRMVGVLPASWRSHYHFGEEVTARVAGSYIRGQLTLALLIGLATALVCLLMGLGNYALFCGLLAFLFETIPMVGPALASLVPLAISLLLPDPFPRTLIILVCFILIQALESNILGPRIVGHAVGLHPIAAILTLLVGAKLFGIFGALLATPVVAVLWVIVNTVYLAVRSNRKLAQENEIPPASA
jgi:predicted PurR-regulated permease PerM